MGDRGVVAEPVHLEAEEAAVVARARRRPVQPAETSGGGAAGRCMLALMREKNNISKNPNSLREFERRESERGLSHGGEATRGKGFDAETVAPGQVPEVVPAPRL